MEKAYHVTTGSHEAMAGTGVSVKDCCLSWVFREHWGLDHKKGWNVPRRQHSLTSVTRKLPVFFRLLVGHSFIYLFKKFVFIPNQVPNPVLRDRETQLNRPHLLLSSIQIQQERLMCKHSEWKTESWLVASFPKPGFEFQEIVFSDGLILSEVAQLCKFYVFGN